MARPQKFRHSVEALSDPQIAEKLGRFVLDIEMLRAKRKQIDDQIASAYDAVDDGGFEKKFVRKVVSLRAKEEGVRREEETNLEAYEIAVEKGVSLACARRELSGQSYAAPKGRSDAKLVETAAAGLQTETGRKALVAALDVMIEAEETIDPETGEIIETQESAVSSDRNEPGRDASLNAPTGSDEMPETVSPAHFLRAGDDGRPQTSTEAYQVKDAGQEGIIVGVYSEQEKAGGPQGGNEAASGLPAPVANSAPVIGHVNFATSSHINPDDMPEIPAFLRRDFERAEA